MTDRAPGDRRTRRWRWWLAGAAASGGLVLVLSHLVLGVYLVRGDSMAPGLRAGDRVLTLDPDWAEIRRGDVVVFRNPTAPGDLLVKRVLALPGERLQARDGTVFVGGFEMAEPYLAPGPRIEDLPPRVVPPDHLFVLGDNRAQSVDSRTFGAVERRLVVGKVLWGP